MAHEYRLHTGQDIALALPAGAEVFCAAGALRLTTTPSLPGDSPWAGPHHLLPGQGWRTEQAVLLTLEAAQPSRCRVTGTPQASAPSAQPAARKNSLLLWGRRLLGAY
ncbi:hypothetical protein [Variovorax terrae]|uniref:Uncharacterized protein n=1 Tax=Variovorax terrae TaxID=2923278 RepID=A0A9X1VYM4_9BURK|nr:hypothetical protein [Variovorax terrae]MCJ0765264.1 hypothetical protein [Variovorax terrae]